MRICNIEVSFKIPIGDNDNSILTDQNDIKYNRDTVCEACEKMVKCPIVYQDNEKSIESVIGIISGVEIGDNDIIVKGILKGGGTNEWCDFNDLNIIDKMDIKCFGIAEH